MSAAWASATVRNASSDPESMTSIVESLDGSTQPPPMKKRSGCWIGAWLWLVTVIVLTALLVRLRWSVAW